MKTLSKKACAGMAVVLTVLIAHADVIIEKDSRKIVALGRNGAELFDRIRLTSCKDTGNQEFPRSRFTLNKGEDCQRSIEQSLPKRLGLECEMSACRVTDVDTASIYFPGVQQSDAVTISVTDDAVVFTYRGMRHTVKR